MNKILDNKLHINIFLNKESTFTGSITLFMNAGGVRAVKEDNGYLKFKKADSTKPERSLASP